MKEERKSDDECSQPDESYKKECQEKNPPRRLDADFFSRHSAQPFERPLREWSSSGPKAAIGLRVRGEESIVVSCGSISLL